MKIKDILKYLANDNVDYEEIGHCYKILELDECELLINYIADLQRKEYNNSKAIEYIKIYKKDFDNYNLKVLKGILKGVVIPVFENEKGE